MYKICTFFLIIVHNLYNVNMEIKKSIEIGQKLRELRKGMGLTQEELTAKLGISRVNYTRYETNKVRPDFETLVLLADFFDVSLDELFGRKEY